MDYLQYKTRPFTKQKKSSLLLSNHKKKFLLQTGFYRVLIADITLSFDNVLGVVGAAKDNYALMIMGLLLSVLLVVTLASYFANYIRNNLWLGYIGIFVIMIVALQLIIGGLINLEVLNINEKFEPFFSI